MNLHEYQAKKLFAEYGLPVSPGKPARSAKQALAIASELGGDGWVVKAQIHAGGRGKAGGVKLVKGIGELEQVVGNMIGTRLITKQSPGDGQPVNCVLIQPIVDIASELYLGMIVDRGSRRIAIMASSAGGIDIEETAATEPKRIHNVHIDPVMGLQEFQNRQIGFALGLDKHQRRQLAGILHDLYRLFVEKDLSLVEINPLAINKAGDLEILDAKVGIDDNALYRQSNLEEWRDITQEDDKESIAKQFDLNYVTLDGNIACMVNGAGLAMATMDIIKLHGGEPANFLDVGGGTTADKVAAAFKLIVSDQNVDAILVNIFGGIVRCDLIADGVVKAFKDVGVEVPVVVRLAGTNVTQGKKILLDSGLKLILADGLSDAANKAVTAAKGKI